jgi:hypothetical protein
MDKGKEFPFFNGKFYEPEGTSWILDHFMLTQAISTGNSCMASAIPFHMPSQSTQPDRESPSRYQGTHARKAAEPIDAKEVTANQLRTNQGDRAS